MIPSYASPASFAATANPGHPADSRTNDVSSGRKKNHPRKKTFRLINRRKSTEENVDSYPPENDEFLLAADMSHVDRGDDRSATIFSLWNEAARKGLASKR
jgi:hypothetical protein